MRNISNTKKYTLKESIIEGKDGCYIMIKGSIQVEDTTLVNIYAPNIEAPKRIK